jgi:hypothetical protein
MDTRPIKIRLMKAEDFDAVGWQADGRYSDDDEKINVAYYKSGTGE